MCTTETQAECSKCWKPLQALVAHHSLSVPEQASRKFSAITSLNSKVVVVVHPSFPPHCAPATPHCKERETSGTTEPHEQPIENDLD